MVNQDCAPFTCLATRVKGKLRYDLFDRDQYALEVRDALSRGSQKYSYSRPYLMCRNLKFCHKYITCNPEQEQSLVLSGRFIVFSQSGAKNL